MRTHSGRPYGAFLRREVDPARVWAAIEAGLESGNDRDRLAASKLLLTELYEPPAEKERERKAEMESARQLLAAKLDDKRARSVMSMLLERGLIRPGGGRAFEGAVFFELRELAEWAGAWAPRPVTVTDVPCATCGRLAVRLVAEGETASAAAVYCSSCEPEANGQP